ncbi:MAG: flavodoxin [Lachnospiraceae bacterium]|nr:flavodoxin [Lachnospiraceae bacterium]
MDKVYIVFWTQTGNTEAMASAIRDGVKETGKDAVLLSPTEASIADLKEVTAFALGCPAMGAEVLEEDEMEPFVTEVEKMAAGKQIALFGSYGWGDGQWMRDWADRMAAAGATVVGGEGVIAQEAPGAEELEACKNLGKTLAEI